MTNQGSLPHASLTGTASSRIYRLHPDLELVPTTSLDSETISRLFEVEALSRYSAILISRSGEQSIKALDPHTEQLLQELHYPAKLSPQQLGILGSRADQVLEKLVLDGILEYKQDEHFISGVAACTTPRTPATQWTDPLSSAAILYAILLPINDPVRLSARMYFYNREPVTSRLIDLYPHTESVRRVLQRELGSILFSDVSAWSCRPSTPDNPGWLIFRRKAANAQKKAPYKIYLSPTSRSFMDFFREVAPLLADEQRVMRFKIGASAHGLARPDKCVAYCQNPEDQAAVCSTLLEHFKDWPAHGVPFTKAECNSLLFSTGTDPLKQERVLPGYEQPSWRLWLTNQIANILAPLKQQSISEAQQLELLQQRLHLAGVQPQDWTLCKGSEYAFN